MIKIKSHTLLLLLVFFSIAEAMAQGSVCADATGDNGADPFCSNVGIVFPNCNNQNADCVNTAESGPNYGCLDRQPYPAWYYLQIDDTGQLVFNIRQTSNEDGTGNPLDVDFICYGPFSDPVTPCTAQLTSVNTVDCSYSDSFNENMVIPNAIAGEYYLVLITNFSELPGFISFQQTSGVGSTDCSILDAALGPNQNLCGTGPIDLDGTTEGAVRYEWSVFNETTMVFDIIAGETSPIYTVAVSGRYQLLVEDIDGDTETDEILITFNEPPVVQSAPVDFTLCEVNANTAEFDFSSNTTLILGTQDPLEYVITYYLSQQDADNKENPITEIYTTASRMIFARIEHTNLETCFETTSFEVFINPAPNLSDSSFTYNICEDADATPNQSLLSFAELIDNLIDSSGQQGQLLADDEPLQLADFVVTYHNSVVDATAGINAIVDNSLVTNGNIIYVRVENNEVSNPTGCFNIDNIAGISISVNQNPELNSTVPNLVECATIIMDQNTAIFDLTNNDSNVSSINNVPGTNVVYYASQQDFDNNSPIGVTESTSFPNTSNPQTIIATVVNPNSGCVTDDSIRFNLVVESLPQLSDNDAFSGTRKICTSIDGTVQNLTTLGEDLSAVDGGEYRYDWTPDNVDLDGDGNEDAIYNIDQLVDAQVFNLVITRMNSSGLGVNCSNAINPVTSEPYEITLMPTASPISVDYDIAEDAFSSSYTITAIPELTIGELSDLEYQLGDGLFQESPTFTNVSAGDYIITVRNKFGCTPEVVSELIQLLDYPKYFTPNNDGFHDTWNLINIEDQPTALIYIFDRYGKLLKQITPGGPGWDGTFNGRNMPSSDYWFRVEYNEPDNGTPKVFAASFTLKR